MENIRDPREHYNEEPRHDFWDVVFGFGGMFIFMTIVFVVAIVVKFIIS